MLSGRGFHTVDAKAIGFYKSLKLAGPLYVFVNHFGGIQPKFPQSLRGLTIYSARFGTTDRTSRERRFLRLGG